MFTLVVNAGEYRMRSEVLRQPFSVFTFLRGISPIQEVGRAQDRSTFNYPYPWQGSRWGCGGRCRTSGVPLWRLLGAVLRGLGETGPSGGQGVVGECGAGRFLTRATDLPFQLGRSQSDTTARQLRGNLVHVLDEAVRDSVLETNPARAIAAPPKPKAKTEKPKRKAAEPIDA